MTDRAAGLALATIYGALTDEEREVFEIERETGDPAAMLIARLITAAATA